MLYKDAVSTILLDLPGAARATVIDAMREMTSHFCRETLAWRDTEKTALVPGIDKYMVGGATGEAIYVFSVTTDSGQTYTTQPVRIIAGEAVIAPPPDVMLVDIEVALSPPFGHQSESIPEALYRYIDALALGTKWRLKSMVGQEWTDPMGADLAYRQYRNRVEQALLDNSTARRVMPRPFV